MPRDLNVHFWDSDANTAVAEHIVEWFDGKTKIAVTKTDTIGRTPLPAAAAAAGELEARVLRPHPDPALAPVLVATTSTVIKPAGQSGELSIEVQTGGFEKIRKANEQKDREKKRATLKNSLGLSIESLRKRIAENNREEMMPGYRAGRAVIVNIGSQLHEYEADALPAGIRDFIEQLRNRQKCACEECESALSPLAYLAHLLDFTTRHVVSATPPIRAVTIPQLDNHFGQPFSSLTKSCQASETELAQALIAIEVLENHFVQVPLTPQQRTALDKERAARLLDAYLVLLQRMGVSYDDLRLADTPDRKAELAALLGIETPRVDSVRLDPAAIPPAPNAITADRLAKLFGLASGQGTTAPDTPEILTWRFESLSRQWEAEDQPTTDELAGAPVIDPDVIGPDDFRNPAAKANTAAPDGPFDIWLRRRAWLDTAETALGALSTVGSMLTRMYQPFQYQGQNITGWLPSTPATDFATISQELLAGVRVDANASRLETDLRISPDAFNRLMALKRKDDLSRLTPPRSEKVSPQERSEVLAILSACIKRRGFVRWVAEELTINLTPDPKYFWVPRRQPTAGEWPRLRLPGEPYLDPAVVSIAELPEGPYGDAARTLLANRIAQLANRRNNLATTREERGFAQSLALGLDWWTVPPGSSTIKEFRALARNFSTPATTAAARARIETELFMMAEDFTQVMQVDQREQAGDRLAAGDYEAFYQILVGAFGRQQFQTWSAQEGGTPYWQLLKQKLVPWRASVDDRVRWQQALLKGLQPVVVDPDLLYASDFVLSRRAYQLWLARNSEVDAHLASLRTQTAAARTTPPTVVERTALDALLLPELQVSAQGLLDLEAAANEGQEVEWRFGQLLLDSESLAELTRIVRAAATTAGTKRLLDSEWEAAFSICTQVWKRRERSVAWQADERMSTATVRPITLSPDFFRIQPPSSVVFPPPSLPPLPAWRASQFARLDWVDKLQSRVDLKTNLGESWRTTLRGAEEIILPRIRDVLLQAADPTGRPVVEIAKTLEREYLIDFRMGGCATTTRVAQAIQTIQALLEGLRTSRSPLTARFQIAINSTFDFAAFDEDLK
jgi:hypothetical protein